MDLATVDREGTLAVAQDDRRSLPSTQGIVASSLGRTTIAWTSSAVDGEMQPAP